LARNSVSWTQKVRSNKNNNEIKGIKTTETDTDTKTYIGPDTMDGLNRKGSW